MAFGATAVRYDELSAAGETTALGPSIASVLLSLLASGLAASDQRFRRF
jgi:hypothetical protein